MQAGVSEATVDRVLNHRPGVRAHTARRVEQALRELDRQSTQLGLAGRKFIIDIVMEAPPRFTEAVRAALEAELPGLHPALFRCRYQTHETMPAAGMASMLQRIALRGSNGVLLKARDDEAIVASVAALARAGIPVVTLVTDLPASPRTAYVGIDNRIAGETAAYLLGEWLGDAPAEILVSLSSNLFHGEEEREAGFRHAIGRRRPPPGIVTITEGHGNHGETGLLARAALARHPGIEAVYSIGGGNTALLDAFVAAGRCCRVFIGHDLDAENIALLHAGRLSAVLHHDLRQDMRAACQQIMRAHRALPAATSAPRSGVQIATPYNLPETV
ncbi:LacI family DNA-binding transcriptional regulator [Lichenicoccus roseus]|uniref:LacI family DNA-binding transcriptional regulator n=1 Tax=Lichenicoccus roseus TaxID=2683649 RepID=UPI0023F19AAD|nr:LacI family DNA-binding transcriptional regulator [Lichenicoccus roseus]